MDQHVKILSILYIVFGVLGFLIGIAAFVFLLGAGAMSGEKDAALITGGIGVLVAIFCTAISIPSIIAGIGLGRRRNWARILAMVIAALNIFNFPIGTGIGIYAFWVLLHQDVAPQFTRPAY